MARTLRLTQRYLHAVQRLGIASRSPEGTALAATARALAAAAELPMVHDQRCLIPPLMPAFVRRVPGANLWLWWTCDNIFVRLVGLTRSPPVPIEE